MRKLLITFTHTNYMLRSAGTEKFIRTFSKTLYEQGYMHLNFFSFYNEPSKKRKSVGVNFNNKFIGIFEYDSLQKIIDYFVASNNLEVVSISIQHLLHHNLEVLSKVIKSCGVNVTLMVHDYYCICNQLKLVDSNGKYCGLTKPNEIKCSNCKNRDLGLQHHEKIVCFIDEIKEYVSGVVTPSEYVSKGLKMIFPDLEKVISVRPHLILTGKQKYEFINGKINIAFAGAQNKEKGFEEWKELISSMESTDRYNFFYLGAGKEEIQGVKNIFVSSAVQGDDAMVNALKNNNIHCAFLWPGWAETYSYVYYELAITGVYILTNSISGNICEEVNAKRNGQIFSDVAECVKWLSDTQNVYECINDYRQNGEFLPDNSVDNKSLKEFVTINNTYVVRHAAKVKKDFKLSFFYEFKYRNLLRKKDGKGKKN